MAWRRILPRLVGFALAILVVWLVGWNDRVTDAEGKEHTGLVLEESDKSVILLADGQEKRIAIQDAGAVERGLRGAFRTIGHRPGWAVLGLISLLCSVLCLQVRWSQFLHGAGLGMPYRQIVRLGWIGMFFNQVLPAGQVGGDLVKGYLIAQRHPQSKTQAVISVLADRGIGLFVLCLAAAVAVFFAPTGSRLDLARTIVLIAFAGCAVFLTLVFVPAIRRPLKLEKWAVRLPFSDLWIRVGKAFGTYGDHPGVLLRAVLIGFGVHATFLGSYYFVGLALGTELSLTGLLIAIPVAQMAGSIPGMPAGWGVGDLAFYFFLPATGVPAGIAVALSFTVRALLMLLSLPGGLLLSRSGGRKELEREARSWSAASGSSEAAGS